MRKLVLALSLVIASGSALPVLGCKHPGSQKLEGRWKGQKAEGVPENVQVAANAFAIGTEIIARGNQIAIQTPGKQTPAATYFVDKEDATTVVIHTDRDRSTETFTFNEKADEMTWKIDAERSIVFKKVQ
jgi:hypothetical protein